MKALKRLGIRATAIIVFSAVALWSVPFSPNKVSTGPLVSAAMTLCIADQNGNPLSQLPGRGQTVRFYVSVGSGFAGGLPIWPIFKEHPVPVEYTIYYTDGPAMIRGLSAAWSDEINGVDYHYTYATIVGHLAQPYVDVRTLGTRTDTNPYEVTLRARQDFVASPHACSDRDSTVVEATPLQDAFVAEYVSQSYPSVMYTSSKAQAWVDLKNAGNVSWMGGTGTLGVLLGTDNPRDRASAFYSPGDWPSPSRPARLYYGALVAPGETARFYFTLQAPMTPGTYKEYFRPVVEGFTWFEDLGIYFQIQVQAAPLTGLNNKIYLPLLSNASSGW